ncbi:hypothetical protein CRUP_034891 [Coryphaenoides rupestris]|nr:hypothetical protein CRUP_034891 [Coryphaenoides rupestris]
MMKPLSELAWFPAAEDPELVVAPGVRTEEEGPQVGVDSEVAVRAPGGGGCVCDVEGVAHASSSSSMGVSWEPPSAEGELESGGAAEPEAQLGAGLLSPEAAAVAPGGGLELWREAKDASASEDRRMFLPDPDLREPPRGPSRPSDALPAAPRTPAPLKPTALRFFCRTSYSWGLRSILRKRNASTGTMQITVAKAMIPPTHLDTDDDDQGRCRGDGKCLVVGQGLGGVLAGVGEDGVGHKEEHHGDLGNR